MPLNESSALVAYHNQPKRKDKGEMTCYHCGKPGHTKEKCYRLVGFPPNFKFTKSKPGYSNGAQSHHSVNQVAAQNQERSHSSPSLPLTADQIQQIAALVNAQSSQLNPKDGSSPTTQPDTQPLAAADSTFLNHHSSNMAGINLQTPTIINLQEFPTHSVQNTHSLTNHKSVQQHTPQWILDTGATDHMVCSTSFLTTITSEKQTQVHLPNRTYASVTHIGTVKISDKLILTNVLCVPTFTFNLISASKLTQKSSVCLIFLEKFCFIQDLSSWMTIGLAEVSNGLYFLKVQSSSCHAVKGPSSVKNNPSQSTCSSNSQNSSSSQTQNFDL